MTIYRGNCEKAVDVLFAAGYAFEKAPLQEPRSDRGETFQTLQELGIEFPNALKAFYEIVGAIEFSPMSEPPWTGCKYPDPASIVPLDSQYWIGEVEAWRDTENFGCFAPQIAGDAIHKAGFSGGGYYVRFDDAEDPTVELADGQTMPFTDYLRLCDSWGGFPGLANCDGHSWPLSELRSDFEPLPSR